jgi:hypothetical protein
VGGKTILGVTNGRFREVQAHEDLRAESAEGCAANRAKISGVCAILDEGGRDTLHHKFSRHSASVRLLAFSMILRCALAIKSSRAAMALFAKD